MDNDTLLILQIFLGILSSTIAIIGLKTVIVPLIDAKRSEQIKKLQKRIKDLEIKAEKIDNSFFVLYNKTNFVPQLDLTHDFNKNNYKQQNNLGQYYLKKSKNVEDKFLKNNFIKTSIKHFESAIKCFGKNKNSPLDIIYVNLADAYDDMYESNKLDIAYENYKNKAIEFCNSALGINPNCDQAYNMLASIYFDIDDDKDTLPKAKKYANTSIGINKCNGFSHLTLAEILIKENYTKNKKPIKEHILSSLRNGCPVWEYIEREIYSEVKNDKTVWKTIKDEIDKFHEINSITGICLQSETEYLI